MKTLLSKQHEAISLLAGTIGAFIRPVKFPKKDKGEGVHHIEKDGKADWVGWAGHNTPGIDWAELTARVYADGGGFASPYQPGDIIAVKEKWAQEYGGGTLYYAGHSHVPPDGRWQSPATMPPYRVRIYIEVVEVSAKRIQDITEEECRLLGLAEVTKDDRKFKWGLPDKDGMPGGYDANTGWPWQEWEATARGAWQKLAEQIHGKEAYQNNIWIWFIKVKPSTKPE